MRPRPRNTDDLTYICHNGQAVTMGMQMRGKAFGSAFLPPSPSDLHGRAIRTQGREKWALRLRAACFVVAILASWAALLVIAWLILRF